MFSCSVVYYYIIINIIAILLLMIDNIVIIICVCLAYNTVYNNIRFMMLYIIVVLYTYSIL